MKLLIMMMVCVPPSHKDTHITNIFKYISVQFFTCLSRWFSLFDFQILLNYFVVGSVPPHGFLHLVIYQESCFPLWSVEIPVWYHPFSNPFPFQKTAGFAHSSSTQINGPVYHRAGSCSLEIFLLYVLPVDRIRKDEGNYTRAYLFHFHPVKTTSYRNPIR